MTRSDPGELAVEYLLAIRRDGAEADACERRIGALDDRELETGLPDDDARVAFWLDVYNAAVVRSGNVDLTDARVRWRFFRRPAIEVAGRRLSLDAIEHGLLRRSRWKLGLGYLGNPLPSRFERAHRVERMDQRIHFALNCGAASCPPIAAYVRSNLDGQLALATRSFLRSSVRADDGALHVPRLLLWYAGDFGGRSGVRRLLREAGIDGWDRPLRFAAYDWRPAPDAWKGGTADSEA